MCPQQIIIFLLFPFTIGTVFITATAILPYIAVISRYKSHIYTFMHNAITIHNDEDGDVNGDGDGNDDDDTTEQDNRVCKYKIISLFCWSWTLYSTHHILFRVLFFLFDCSPPCNNYYNSNHHRSINSTNTSGTHTLQTHVQHMRICLHPKCSRPMIWVHQHQHISSQFLSTLSKKFDRCTM